MLPLAFAPNLVQVIGVTEVAEADPAKTTDPTTDSGRATRTDSANSFLTRTPAFPATIYFRNVTLQAYFFA
ncbi:MAG: hypothetical protein WAM97_14205, partial [Acidimicrobiales bacterium]